jgi:hypothetical protein
VCAAVHGNEIWSLEKQSKSPTYFGKFRWSHQLVNSSTSPKIYYGTVLSFPPITINSRAGSDQNAVVLRKECVYVIDLYRVLKQQGVGTLNKQNCFFTITFDSVTRWGRRIKLRRKFPKKSGAFQTRTLRIAANFCATAPLLNERKIHKNQSNNNSQGGALFFKFILVKNSTRFGQTYCPSSGVLILYSQQLVFVILVMLTVC